MRQPGSLDVRPSPIAGLWYPADPEVLRQEIDLYLTHSPAECPQGTVHGLLAPHAGLRYSGPVAASAFKCLSARRPQVVAVLSPYHNPHPAPLLTSGHRAYDTPFGPVQVDPDLVQRLHQHLTARLGFGLTPIRRDPEHAVEIELPFLQRLLPEFRLVPVMMRDQSPRTVRALAAALVETLAEVDAVLVASSDLSHYYPQDVAESLDRRLLRRIQRFNAQGVEELCEQGRAYACGCGAIVAVMQAAQAMGADRARVVHYATSGETSGDYSSVVGYAAAVFWKAAAPEPDPGPRRH